MTLYTIGHSHTPIERFSELLTLHRIETLTDVRSQPHSRFAPQYNRPTLEAALAQAGIVSRYRGDTRGGRPQNPRYRRPDGTVDYPRLAQAPHYRQGLHDLQREAEQSPLAIMCAEADFRKCHRYWLITRSLLDEGLEVRHILSSGALVGTAPDAFRGVPDQIGRAHV
jgi:uncharacterized protein (DUF488 family)